MKNSFKLNGNFLHSLKNFWFGLQLLIVSVSLPVISFIQVSCRGSKAHTKKVEKTKGASATQDEMAAWQKQEKTAKLNVR